MSNSDKNGSFFSRLGSKRPNTVKSNGHRVYEPLKTQDGPFTSSEEVILKQDERLVDSEPVEKTDLLAYWIFFILGLGIQFPWNAFITCNLYFEYRLSDSSFSSNFHHYFPLAFLTTNVCMLALLQRFSKSRPLYRIIGSLALNAVVFSMCLVLTQIPSISAYPFFALNIVFVMISGSCTAILQSGVFAFSSLFPGIYTQAIMSGQGLSGTVVSLSQIITIALSPNSADSEKLDPSFAAALYFSFAILVIFVCIAGSLSLKHTETYRKLIKTPGETVEEEQLLGQTEAIEQGNYSNSMIFGMIWPAALAVFLIFTVTLSLFPPIVSVIESVWPSEFNSRYFVSISFLVFSVGDWIGKSAPAFPRIPIPFSEGVRVDFARPESQNRILALSVGRVVFVPLLLLCNIVLRSSPDSPPLYKLLPTLFTSDIVFYAILFFFSVSNGWIGSLAMMHGPKHIKVTNETSQKDVQEMQRMAGNFMVFSLTAGLLAGTVISFGIRSVICGFCNPFVN